MASYPELRPGGSRPATARRFLRPGPHAPLGLAAASAALVVAFLVVSQLIGNGGKASTPAFLAKALGARTPSAPLVRTPAKGVDVTLAHRGGYRIAQGGGSFSLAAETPGGAWHSFAHGVSRETPFGRETVTVDRLKTEESLVVMDHRGKATWRWRLNVPAGERPRITSRGAVGFVAGHRVLPLSIAPVKILAASGADVTPAGARWSVTRRGQGWWLTLRLDDSKLPLPYVIDPISFHTQLGSVNALAGATTLDLTMPSATAVSAGDMMIAQVTWKGGTGVPFVKAPSNWNIIGSRVDETTNMGAAIYSAQATSAEPASYTWQFFQADQSTAVSAIAAGGISAWTGVAANVAIANGTPWTRGPGANNTSITIPSVTTTVANSVDVAIPNVNASATVTQAAGMTERLADTANAGGITTENADVTQAAVGASGTRTVTLSNGAPKNASAIDFQIALAPDTTGPTHSPSQTPVSGSTYWKAATNTVYYRGSVAGSFRLNDALTDAGSGPKSVQYPLVTGVPGWTHALETVSTGPSYQSSLYSWSAGSTTSPGAQTLTGADNGGNTSTASVTITNDTGVPSTPSVALSSGPWYTSTSVGLTPTDGTDGGSGIDTSSRVYERDEVALTNGSCGVFPGTWGTTVSNPDASVQSGKCYQYRLKESDNVGNQSLASAATAAAKVDTTAPSAPTYTYGTFTNAYYDSTGGILYYRPGASGSFVVTADSTDGQSGVSGYTFPASGPSGWTISGSGASRTYGWTPAPSALGSQSVSATNGAGTQTSSTFSATADSSAPSAQTISLSGANQPYYGSASVSFSVGDGSDTGSGLDTSTRTVSRETATLSGDSCSGWASDPGTYTSPDGSVSTGRCYRYTFTIKDKVGNVSSGVSATAKVDTSGPGAPGFSYGSFTNAALTGGVVFFASGAGSGQFAVTASAGDGETPVSSYSFPTLTGWTKNVSGTTATYSHSGSPSDPAEPNNVTATNAAGVVGSVASFTVTADSAAPATSIGCSGTCGGWHPGAVTVTLAGDDGTGSGVSQTRYTTDGTTPTLVNGSTYVAPFSVPASATVQFRSYDNVGNAESTNSQAIQVDTTAPTAPGLSFGSFTNATASGSSVYYRPGTSGSFAVTASSSDSESGVASYAFPALGTGWSGSQAGTVETYSWNGTPTPPSGSQNVTATNNAGTASGASAFTVVADSAAPTTSAQCNGAACAGIYSGPVTVTLSASDGGSGVTQIKYTTDGTDPSPLNGAVYVAPFSFPTTGTLKFRAYDGVGNEESVGSQAITINSKPDAPSLGFGGFTSASASGSTVYYRGSAGGGFSVTGTTGYTGGSPVDHFNFPTFGAGWTGGGADNGSPYQGDYTFAAGAAEPGGGQNVTVTNTSGFTSDPTAFGVTLDSTAPSGMSATVAGGYVTTLSVPVTLGNGTDSGSGVDPASGIVERDSAALGGGACDPFTASWQQVTLVAGNDTSVVSGNCYRYRYSVADGVGNRAVSAASSTAKVDTSAPAAPALSFDSLTNAYASGSTVFFRTSVVGSFTIEAGSSDAQSGVASHTFPTLGSGWTGGGTVAGPTASAAYVFNASATAPGSGRNVIATNNAGLVSSATSFTVTGDGAAPTSSISCSGGCGGWHTGPVSVTLSADDGSGSGVGQIKYTTDGSDPTSGGTVYSGAFTVSASATVKYAASDNVGNVETVRSQALQVDATAPSTPTLSLTAGANASVSGQTAFFRSGASGSFDVTASSSDAESGVGSYGYPALGSGWSASQSGGTDTYTFDASAADPSEPNNVTATNNAGLTSGATSFTVTADGAAPTTTISCSSGCSGWHPSTVTVTLGASDGSGSGVSQIKYTTDGSDPLSGGNVYSTPFSVGASATVKYAAIDKVGNTEAVGSQALQVDTSAPSAPTVSFGSFTNASATGMQVFFRPGSSGGLTVTASGASDPDSGIALLTFPSLGSGWSSSQSGTSDAYSFDATAAAPSANQNVFATNGSGLVSTNVPFTVTADSAAPTSSIACSGGCGGWHTSSPVSVTLSADDGSGSGLQEIRYTTDGSDPTPLNGSVYTAPFDVAASATVKYRAYDKVRNTEAVRTTAIQVDTTPPSAPTLSFSALTNASASGSQVFFRPGASGGFTVTASGMSDAESGIGSVSFPALGTGWSGSPSGFSDAYSFTSSAATPSGNQDVAAVNGAGLGSAATPFTLSADSSAPTGSIACSGSCGGWHSSSVTVTLSADDGSGSGVNQIKYTTDGSDPSSGGTVYGGPFSVGSTATVKFVASDKVGNLESVRSQLVQVDTSKPNAPSLSFSNLTNASVSGQTVFFRTGAAGGFRVSASAADAESGVASYAFPGLGSGWAGSPSGAAEDYSFNASAADPAEPNDVTATNNAGLASDPSSFTVTADGAAPTTTMQCGGSPCGSGWVTSAPVSITLTADDGSGSGTAQIKYTTDGSDPTTSGTIYSGAFSAGASTTVKFAAYDNVGNVEAVQSKTIQIDTTKPGAPTLSLSNPANASISGSTVYFRAGAAGGFRVTGSSSDGESGIGSYSFPGLGSGWSGSQSGASYDYSFGAAAADPAEPNNVAAINNAGLASDPTSFTVTADGAAPTTSISCSGGCSGWHTSSPVTVTLSASDGSGSGVTEIRYTTDGSDPTPLNGSVYVAPFDVPASATVKYRAFDAVGNAEAVRTASIQVDTTAPAAPSLSIASLTNAAASGQTVFFRSGAAGSFDVNASAVDAESGIGGYSFPNLGFGWSRTVSGATATYSFNAAAADPSEPNAVTATNNAGLSSPASSFTVTADASAPASTIACSGGCAGWHSSAITVTLSADDGSGAGVNQIKYTTDGSDPLAAGGSVYSGPFSAPATATLKVASTDKVGNAEAVQTRSLQIDTSKPSAPTLSFSNLTNASASGSTVFFRAGAAGGFRVSAASTDPDSGVGSYSFPALGSGWSGSPSGAADDYSFTSAAADPAEPNNVTGTNNAGLVSDPGAFTVTSDGAAPTSSSSCTGGCAGWHSTAVTVGLSADDGSGSGLDQIRYTTDGSDPTTSGTLYSGPFSVSVTTTVKYSASDKVGNVEAVRSQLVQVDGAPPAVSLTSPADGSYVNAAHADPYTVAAAASDTQSGVASVEFFECADMTANCSSGAWSSIGIDLVGPPFQASWNLPANGNRALEAVATDGSGRQSASVVNVSVDRALPSVTIDDPGASLHGTVGLTASAADPETGLQQVQFQRCASPCGGSWTNVGAADASSPYSAAFDTTAVADGDYDLRAVATDNAGNVRTASIAARTVDNDAPETTITSGPTGIVSSPAASFAFSSDESGSSFECSLDGATFSGCSSPASYTSLAEGTHGFRVRATDAAGNDDASPASRSWTIDTVDPTSSYDFPAAGGTYRSATWNGGCASSGFCGAAADSGSGLQQVELSIRRLSDGSYWNGSSFAALTETFLNATMSGSSWSYGFPAANFPAAGDYTVKLRATDNAGHQQSGSSRTFTFDAAAPTGSVAAPADGDHVRGSIAVTANAADVGSGVTSVDFQVKATGASSFTSLGTDATAPYSKTWDTTSAAEGPADLRAVVTDNAGNTTTTAAITVVVDNVSPVVDLDDPGASLRGSAASFNATASADTTQVDFYRSPAGANAWVKFDADTAAPYAAQLDTTTPATPDGLYDFRAVAVDAAGNTGTSQTRTTKIDNSPPSGSLTAPSAGEVVGGPSVALAATAADGSGSGVVSVRFERRFGAGPWIAIATDTSMPYAASLDATALASGSYDLRVLVADAAGNQAGSAPVTVTVDSTPPTVSLDDPGAYLSGSAVLRATAVGGDHVVFERRPAGGGAWTAVGTATAAPWSVPFNTAAVADGDYDFRAVAYDSVGNSAADERDGIHVDNTAPLLVASSPADGQTLAAVTTVVLTANEALATIQNPTLDGAPLAAPVVGGATATFATAGLASGPHVLDGRLEDLGGQSRYVLVHFTVWNAVGETPAVEKNSPLAAGTTVAAADAAAKLTTPANVVADPGNGDWLVVRVNPNPAPTDLASGFASAGQVIDASAYWAVGGGQVHSFAKPLDLAIGNATGGPVVAATHESGAWRVLRNVPSAGTLPAGWSDGFYASGAEVHVLTTHLSEFALLRDVEAPTAPSAFGGTVGTDGLTLTWQPGSDNSGLLDHVSLFVNGERFLNVSSSETQAKVGSFRADDTRTFSLSDTDAAGNESARTHKLLAVPDLGGMSLDEARAALSARGFNLGAVRTVGSTTTAPGTVVGGGAIRLAEEGSSIDLMVSAGAAGPLGFAVSHAGKLEWSKSKTLTARLTSSKPARVAVGLVSPRGKPIRAWQLQAAAGSTTVKLRFPAAAAAAGRYTLSWTATADGSKPLSTTTSVRLVLPKTKKNKNKHKKPRVATFAAPPATPPAAPRPRPLPSRIIARSAWPLASPVTAHAGAAKPSRPVASWHRTAFDTPESLKPIVDALAPQPAGHEQDNWLIGVLVVLAGVFLLGAYVLSLGAAVGPRRLATSTSS